MPFEHMLQNRRTEPLSKDEFALLEDAISDIRTYAEGEIVVRQGVPLDVSTMLVSGTMTRHMYDATGRRHLVGLHFAGDFVDLHAYALKVLEHNVGALTTVTVATVPHEALRKIQADHPDLMRRLWFLTLIDAAMHRQWSFRLASLSAIARIAHFLCETNARLLAIGISDGRRFAFSMTQAEIGEACSLTNVHVNRVMRVLRDMGLCTFRSSVVEIHDLEGLVKLGQFRPDYLYLNDVTSQRALGLIRSEDV